MTDQDDERFLTTAQVLDFIEKKGIEKDCELCGKNVWRIPTAGGTGGPMEPLTVGDRRLKRYFPVYVMYCGNCGNTKLLHVGTIEDWAAQDG